VYNGFGSIIWVCRNCYRTVP